MSYFDDVYMKRINRYGLDYQSRIQGEREKLFDQYLLKTIYRVEFNFNDNIVVGSLEKKSQDETKTLQNLLVKTSVNIPNGTILTIKDKDNNEFHWMIYYFENIEASGYNKYIVLKMSHYITWTARDGSTQNSWAYLYGQEDNMLKDEIRSRSRMNTIYSENLKTSFFILPKNGKIKKDDYLVIGSGDTQEQFVVTGYDILSSDGVEYVTIDPTYERDLTDAPDKTASDSSTDFYWLNKGGES